MADVEQKVIGQSLIVIQVTHVERDGQQRQVTQIIGVAGIMPDDPAYLAALLRGHADAIENAAGKPKIAVPRLLIPNGVGTLKN